MSNSCALPGRWFRDDLGFQLLIAAAYQKRLTEAGFGKITTEIVSAGEFYFAEDYHQQYLSDAKNPYGYCPDHGTGVSCPTGVVKASD